MALSATDIKTAIRDLSDISLKIITDLVAYQIRKGSYNKSPGANYMAAEEAVSIFVSENFSSIEELALRLADGGGMEKIKSLANTIYDHYYKTPPDFASVKERIGAKKDISLKAITDMTAYKISQSLDDKGPEINYLTAETFVAQYIADNFDDIGAFKDKLNAFSDSMKGIEHFADIIYDKYCAPDKGTFEG